MRVQKVGLCAHVYLSLYLSVVVVVVVVDVVIKCIAFELRIRTDVYQVENRRGRVRKRPLMWKIGTNGGYYSLVRLSLGLDVLWSNGEPFNGFSPSPNQSSYLLEKQNA